MFQVCRVHVGEALLWLKENNPRYYGDIVIDRARLERLPEEDVPDEIWQVVRQEPNFAVAEMERAGYGAELSDGNESNPEGKCSYEMYSLVLKVGYQLQPYKITMQTSYRYITSGY